MQNTIKAEWAGPCPDCGAMGGCCAASKERRDVADGLGQLVDRQSKTITRLTRERAEWKAVADSLVTRPTKETLDKVLSDLAELKFDIETYKTRALNAEARLKSKGVA